MLSPKPASPNTMAGEITSIELQAVVGAVSFQAATTTAAQPNVTNDDGNVTDSATINDNIEYRKESPEEEFGTIGKDACDYNSCGNGASRDGNGTSRDCGGDRGCASHSQSQLREEKQERGRGRSGSLHLQYTIGPNGPGP